MVNGVGKKISGLDAELEAEYPLLVLELRFSLNVAFNQISPSCECDEVYSTLYFVL